MTQSHCTPDELIDVVDGLTEESALPHLADCAACREQLGGLRDVLAQVERVAVPEPSPLFWDHFSARVRQAVADAALPPVRQPWLPRWGILGPGLAAGAVLALLVALWPRTDSRPEQTRTAGQSTAVETTVEPAAWADPDDASIGLMMELASGVDLDSVAAAGLTASTGATDAAVTDLSIDERRELERLLKEAMGRPGA